MSGNKITKLSRQFREKLSEDSKAKLDTLLSSPRVEEIQKFIDGDSPEAINLKAEIQRVIEGNQTNGSASEIQKIFDILNELKGNVTEVDISQLRTEVSYLVGVIEKENANQDAMKDTKPDGDPKDPNAKLCEETQRAGLKLNL